MQKGFKAARINEEMNAALVNMKAQPEECARKYTELEELRYHSDKSSRSAASEENAAPMSSFFQSSTFPQPLARAGAGAAAGISHGGERCGGG